MASSFPSMNTMMTRLFVAALLAAVASSGLPAAEMSSAADEAAIRQRCAEFVAAWNRHDPHAMAATWTEDGDVINPAGREAKGRAGIEQILAEEHNGALRGSTYVAHKIDVRFFAPTIAVADWTSEVTNIRDPQGAAAPNLKHHVTSVFVKHDGQWHAAMVRAFAPLPPMGPPPKPAM